MGLDFVEESISRTSAWNLGSEFTTFNPPLMLPLLLLICYEISISAIWGLIFHSRSDEEEKGGTRVLAIVGMSICFVF